MLIALTDHDRKIIVHALRVAAVSEEENIETIKKDPEFEPLHLYRTVERLTQRMYDCERLACQLEEMADREARP